MVKDLLLEQELLDIINKELIKKRAHKDYHCEVARLKEANLPGRNWKIDTFNSGGTGGNTLNSSKECDELLQNVLPELVAKYDVRWLRE